MLIGLGRPLRSAAILLWICLAVRADASGPLFLPAGDATVIKNDRVSRSRLVWVNFDAIRPWLDANFFPPAKSAALELNLFDDTTLALNPGTVAHGANGSLVIQGAVKGEEAGIAQIAVRGDAMVAVAHIPGQSSYALQPSGDGTHTVFELDPSAETQCGIEPKHFVSAPGVPAPSLKGADVFPVVDVFVAYTSRVREAMGGTGGVEALIDLAVGQCNGSYVSSEIELRVRLVGTREVDYVASGRLNRDLDRISIPDDGYLDDLHSDRDERGADCVILMTENGDSAGLSWIMQQNSLAFAPFAYGIVDYRFAITRFVFAHELGHLLGAGHERSLGSTPGVGLYARALVRQDFRTIMAAVSSSESISFFSNPNVLFEGEPTGRDGSVFEAADNARALNLTGVTAAQYRVRDFDIAPAVIEVPPTSGTVFLNVQYGGAGTVAWEAAIDDNVPWLGFGSGATGENNGTLSVGFEANPNNFRREAIVRVSGSGAVENEVFTVIRQEAECLDETIPGPPKNVDATDSEFDSRIRITWDAVDGAYEYRVFRGVEPDFEKAIDVSPWVKELAFDDVSARGVHSPIPGCKQLEEPPTLYYYWVKSRNECGESDASDYDEGKKAEPQSKTAALHWLALIVLAYAATRARRKTA